MLRLTTIIERNKVRRNMKADYTNIGIVLNVFDVIKIIEEALISVISNSDNAFLLTVIEIGLNSISLVIQCGKSPGILLIFPERHCFPT